MHLILVRHGETASNRQRLGLGRQDVPLTELGRRQAEALAGCLERMPVAAVYSSPLCRALDTARAIADRFGLAVEVEEGLSEMDVGEMDGLTFEEMRQRHAEFLRRWQGSELATLRMPGGESLQDVQERATAALRRIAERHPNDTVVAVSHNFTIRVLLCHALSLPIAEFRCLRHDLAAMTTLDVRGQRMILVHLNDTYHLEAQGLAAEAP
jgi:broad specificity phosphatase PhoE